jgi:hypothetical protein
MRFIWASSRIAWNIQPRAESRVEYFPYLLAWRVFQQRASVYDYVSSVWDGEHGARMNFIRILSWRSRAGIFLEAWLGVGVLVH